MKKELELICETSKKKREAATIIIYTDNLNIISSNYKNEHCINIQYFQKKLIILYLNNIMKKTQTTNDMQPLLYQVISTKNA